MKKYYLLVLGLLCSFIGFSQVVIDWEKSFGGSAQDDAYHMDLTSDGGFIVTGRTNSVNGDVTNNQGSLDVWLIKLDSNGNLQWQKTYGGSSVDEGHSVMQTVDGGYIIGGTTASNNGDVTGNHGLTDYWVIKTDNIGNLVWQKTYGGSGYDYARDIKKTSDGGFIVTGSTDSNDGDVSGNHGYIDYWVVKIDSIGNIEWQKCLGGTDFDYFSYSVLQTKDGGYIVAGESGSNDGDVSFNHGGYDMWIVKLDTIGSIEWENSYGGSDFDGAYSIQETSDNGYIIAGYALSNDGQVGVNQGEEDCWIIKIDSIGALQWQNSFGGTLVDEITCVELTSDGGYIVAAYSFSNDGNVLCNIGVRDYWIIKFDNSSNIQWQSCFGGTSGEIPHIIKEVTPGAYVIAGSSSSSDGDVSGYIGGLTDFWVVKLTENHNLITGNLFVDLNSNAVFDTAEPVLSNYTIYETGTNRFTISNPSGLYYLSVPNSGSFTVQSLPLANYNSVPISQNVTFSGINETDSLNNFAFQPSGIANDLKVTLSPLTPFRPGFDALYNIKYKNVGTTTIGGSVIFYPDSNLTFVSASIPPSNITTDSITWSASLLSPFEEEDIIITVNLNASTALGVPVTSNVLLNPLLGDANPADNDASWTVTTQGSYDPNDIIVNRSFISTDDIVLSPELEYLIRFQNTGTDTAFTVKIKNPLPLNTILYTFEFIESSHQVQLNYNNADSIMWFQFDNILLPDSNSNELLSHGYVRYKIKPLPTLWAGDLIPNQAYIFFDFNAPVITNVAETDIILLISVNEIIPQFDFSIYPNPVTNEINIPFVLDSPANLNVSIYNLVGQLKTTIKNKQLPAGKNNINFLTESLSTGVYYLTLEINGISATRKFIKF